MQFTLTHLLLRSLTDIVCVTLACSKLKITSKAEASILGVGGGGAGGSHPPMENIGDKQIVLPTDKYFDNLKKIITCNARIGLKSTRKQCKLT